MSKEEKSGAAQTATSKSEMGVRDVIRTMKKNKKAIGTLKTIGAKKPGIAQAIAAIEEEQSKLKGVAQAIVMREIEVALKDDDE